MSGCARCTGMSASGDQRGHSVRRQAGQTKRVGTESGVVGSGQGEQGRGHQVGIAIPQRLLRARAGQAQARGKPGRAIAPPLVCLGRTGQPDEHRAADPLRSMKASTSPDASSAAVAAFVGLSPPRGRASGFSMPPVAPIRMSRPNSVEVGAGGHVEGDTGAERVAEKITRRRADSRRDRVAHQGSAVAGRSARTWSEPPWPGRSIPIRV